MQPRTKIYRQSPPGACAASLYRTCYSTQGIAMAWLIRRVMLPGCNLPRAHRLLPAAALYASECAPAGEWFIPRATVVQGSHKPKASRETPQAVSLAQLHSTSFIFHHFHQLPYQAFRGSPRIYMLPGAVT